MSKMICANCQWFDLGKCRINPPVVLAYPAFNDWPPNVETVWPEVKGSDWCSKCSVRSES